MNEKPTAEGDHTARLARTVVASLFVAGAVAVLVMRPTPDTSQVADTTPPAFLHTPVADVIGRGGGEDDVFGIRRGIEPLFRGEERDMRAVESEG